MFVESINLPETTKVWIYPSSRKFYKEEIAPLHEKIKAFIDSWKVDEPEFQASYSLHYDRFIVFYADASAINLTNSDIDTSVAFILSLEKEYEVQLLDRMNVCFKQGEYVQYKDLKDFKKLLKNKAVTPKTIVFDNLITTKSELKEFWEIPITESWYSRFVK